MKISKKEKNYKNGYDYAIFLLGLRMRTIGEIRAKMHDQKYSDEIINNVVDELIRRKFLDDMYYANVLVQSYKQYKPYGYMKVRYKMMEKKLSKEIISSELDENFTMEDEKIIAKRVLTKIGFKKDWELDKRQKAARGLAAKGFRMEVIRELVLFN